MFAKAKKLVIGTFATTQTDMFSQIISAVGSPLSDQNVIPYKGSVTALNDLLNKTINLALIPTKTIASLVDAGKLVSLGESGAGGELEKAYPGFNHYAIQMAYRQQGMPDATKQEWLTLIAGYVKSPEAIKDFKESHARRVKLGEEYTDEIQKKLKTIR